MDTDLQRVVAARGEFLKTLVGEGVEGAALSHHESTERSGTGFGDTTVHTAAPRGRGQASRGVGLGTAAGPTEQRGQLVQIHLHNRSG